MPMFNPMLAAEGELGKIQYPKVAMPKLNGVRGINQDGQLVARSLKAIPNDYVRTVLSDEELAGLDGELVVGDHAHEDVFAISTSGIMSKEGTPDFVWHVFDVFHDSFRYLDRLARRDLQLAQFEDPRIQRVPWKIIQNDDELQEEADIALKAGYEGLVLRSPNAPYKQGRSTQIEGGFLRYCPWLRSEALILRIDEGFINTNESKKNELGYLKKSLAKGGLVGSGQAGSVFVRDIKTGIEFNMAVPTDALQKEMWANQDKYLMKLVKYKFKPAVKAGGKPRFPQWEGLRAPEDMSQ